MLCAKILVKIAYPSILRHTKTAYGFKDEFTEAFTGTVAGYNLFMVSKMLSQRGILRDDRYIGSFQHREIKETVASSSGTSNAQPCS